MRIRTRTLRVISGKVPLEALVRWRDEGRMRLFAPFLRRGELLISQGLLQGVRLSARHFDVAGAQSFHVLRGTHEPMVQEALRRSLPVDGVLFDVGANVGFMTLVGARIVGPRGQVVAIDPMAENAVAVADHARLNGLEQIWIVHAAAAASSGEAEVIEVRDSLWTRLASVGEHPLEVRRSTVRAVALDDLLGEDGVRPPDLVKIDVEGGEMEVLEGMRRILHELRPVVVCEMHGKNAAFCEFMRDAGYRVVNLDGPEPVEVADGNTHALAEPLG